MIMKKVLAILTIIALLHLPHLAGCGQLKIANTPLHQRLESAKASLHENANTEIDVPLEPVPFPLALAPYCTTGRLNLTATENSCTAFMITENHALTAGQCVKKDPSDTHTEMQPLEKLDLCLFRSCTDKGWCLKASKVRLALDADYALITYREQSPCQYALGYFSDSDWGSTVVELFGYPDDPPKSEDLPNDCQYNPMFHSTCSSSWRNTANNIVYHCETRSGMSGSPVTRPWVSKAFGVHSSTDKGKGHGVPMTEARYCKIASWIWEDGNEKFGRDVCIN